MESLIWSVCATLQNVKGFILANRFWGSTMNTNDSKPEEFAEFMNQFHKE